MTQSLEEITAKINRTNRKVSRLLDALLHQYGVTPEQWNVLNQLNHHGAVTQKNLSDIMDKDQPTVTRILDLLEKKQLACRVANQQDRRSFLLSVTPAGQSLLKQLAAPLETQLRTVVFKNMSTTQLEQLCQLLETVKNNLQEASF